jgi:hypothetical protein
VAEVEGSCDDLFTSVPSVLARLLDEGDTGAAAAVYVDGEPVVDVWGGFADAGRTIPWQRDTIVNVWSVTKTMTALCALLLADRGELDLDAPVVRYWPQFAASAKQGVLVRHLLAHTAGLPDWDGPVEDLYDWPTATARLAAQAPRWEPGTAASGWTPSTTTASRARYRRPRRPRTTLPVRPETPSPPHPPRPSRSATATAWHGAGPRSRPGADSATRAPSPWCSRFWPAAARCAACGCCPRRAGGVVRDEPDVRTRLRQRDPRT